MLHAFNADTGEEMWAYIPRRLLPTCGSSPTRAYATKHQYFVDGSPSSMDVWDGSNWRTILVGGLNAGGRGYYALDMTVPGAPKALWEICSDSTPVLDLGRRTSATPSATRSSPSAPTTTNGWCCHLRLQQREPGRWKGLAVRAGCADRLDPGQSQHRRGFHDRAERAGQDRGLGRQLLRGQHRTLCLRRRFGGQRLEVRSHQERMPRSSAWGSLRMPAATRNPLPRGPSSAW